MKSKKRKMKSWNRMAGSRGLEKKTSRKSIDLSSKTRRSGLRPKKTTTKIEKE
jgi:hypothetical protein